MAYKPKSHQMPAWSLVSGTYPGVPDEPSKWEKFLLAEQIDEKDAGDNPKVLAFILKNCRTYFVPTKVLKLYGLDHEDA